VFAPSTQMEETIVVKENGTFSTPTRRKSKRKVCSPAKSNPMDLTPKSIERSQHVSLQDTNLKENIRTSYRIDTTIVKGVD
jgi:hypothetical protein